MPKKFKLKVLLVIGILLICGIYLLPSTGIKLPAWWQSFLPTSSVRLGLDLQGGVHLLMEVDVEKALQASAERYSQDINYRLMEDKIRMTQPEVDKERKIHFSLITESDKAGAEEALAKNYNIFDIKNQGLAYTLSFKPEVIKDFIDKTHSQALETVRNRIDMFGVAEPEIVPQADNRILVQLPGMDDTERAIQLIGKTALLEFRLVEDINPSGFTPETVPQGTVMMYEHHRDPSTGRVTKTPLILRNRASMTGETIVDARVNPPNQHGAVSVSISFNEQGGRQFADLTTHNVNRRLAIVLDGVIQSAPNIKEPITRGQASIDSQVMTMDQGRDLAVALRSGALPAPVNILEKRTVGPSLGKDSIEKGITSTLIGGALILLFMVIYYRISGFAADIAVALNIFILLAVMVAMGATLTLPGIAGIILTIGMAVDANVLINERIREELRLGKTPAAAVETGYARATVTILDANITTILAAIVLYQFGTGPIKGFAVTLTIGLLSSMFTAIFVTRLLFDYVIRRYRPKTLSI